MAAKRLTDAAIRRINPKRGQRIDTSDGASPGLILRTTGTGGEPRRVFTLLYRRHGVQRRATLGNYPAMSLAAAHAAAQAFRSALQAGGNPAATPSPEAAPATVVEVATAYLARLQRLERSSHYLTDTQANLRNSILPALEKREIGTVTRADVVALLDDIATGQSNGRKLAGGPVVSNRCLATIRGLFNHAVDDLELIEATPVRRLKPRDETPRDRVLSTSEISHLWPRMDFYPCGIALRMMLLTAQRKTEVASMRWSDLDLVEGLWTLPATSTKSGRLSVVPLSNAATDILAKLQKIDGEYVFTSGNSKPICGFATALNKINGGESVQPWTIHDLRRTAATEMGRLGTSEFIISKILNHSVRGVTGRVYNRYEYLAEKRTALDSWASSLGNLTKIAG